MHKLNLDSLAVTSFEPAPAAVELADPTEPTYPRCTANLTGCIFCQPPVTE